MEKIRLWWQARSARDRRALVILLLVVPTLLGWYFVTRPLEDRLKLAHRVLATSRSQAEELQKKLTEYSELRNKSLSTEIIASQEVVTSLENVFRSLSHGIATPTLNRTTLTILGKRQPAAQVSFDRADPAHAWQILEAIASVGVNVAELELTSDPKKNQLSAQIKAWQ